MNFHYKAFQQDDKVKEGDLEAKNQAEVLSYLAAQGLKPITIRTTDSTSMGKAAHRIFGEKITLSDKVFLTKYLALMLRSGIDLFKAIDILIADFEKPIIKALLIEIRTGLEKGQPFHTTFAKYPKFFSSVFVNLIKAGESSGNLDQVFQDLNTSLVKENELRGRIRAALVYPTLLLVMAVIILTFLVTFALPKIADVFNGGGFNPPLFSRVVFAIGLFLGKYIWIILAVVIVMVSFLSYFFSKVQMGRELLNKFLNNTPFVRKIIKELALQRFAETLGSLMKSGLPIVESLEITASAVGYEDIAASLRRIANEGVVRGLTIGDAFRNEVAFPKVVTNLVAISEKAGHLDEILKTLSDFYELEIDSSLKTLVSFLEPALLLMIGGIVAAIALAIIVPIYQLVGQF